MEHVYLETEGIMKPTVEYTVSVIPCKQPANFGAMSISAGSLEAAWNPTEKKFKNFSHTFQKNIIKSEFFAHKILQEALLT